MSTEFALNVPSPITIFTEGSDDILILHYFETLPVQY